MAKSEAGRELLDNLRARWDDRMRWTRSLRDKYERDKTDANWQEYREMMAMRDDSWAEYETAKKEVHSDREE